ncbi:Predicted amidohydrolase [Streptomyces sp. DvalAA-14]|uniref:carbon-nitrogen hydrolase family protein n=1 Tax=unclassified Streptomyces TaxID=2593676 RepID=UPI00081AF74B|nr:MULTISPECIES: carbon-nitrogen hydrolase family protein [unclassified Streptomyces]MYS24593.1 carbon-nitrogen hydrolase [Streptomyces sp. SID4948]SCE47526.1 Predicted amidohydrolase [Streptomyces sp. DvalAA-14]
MAPLRTALLQGPGGTPGSVAESLAVLAEAAGRAAGQGARLLVTSELFLTGYAPGGHWARLAEAAGGPAEQQVARIAARHRIGIVYGSPERDGEDVFNTARFIGPDGTPLAAYRKAHLFGTFERDAFTPGADPVVQAELDGIRVGLLICYDVEFPEAVRAHALAGTELLAVPTALMRPYEFVAHTLVPARAFENGLHIAYANRCGPEGGYDFAGLSCLAGPDGVVRARGGAGADLLVADADPAANRAARAETPYLTDRRPELYGCLAAPTAPPSARRTAP